MLATDNIGPCDAAPKWMAATLSLKLWSVPRHSQKTAVSSFPLRTKSTHCVQSLMTCSAAGLSKYGTLRRERQDLVSVKSVNTTLQ